MTEEKKWKEGAIALDKIVFCTNLCLLLELVLEFIYYLDSLVLKNGLWLSIYPDSIDRCVHESAPLCTVVFHSLYSTSKF